MTLGINKIVVLTSALCLIVWCGFINQGMISAFGGTFVVFIEVLLACFILSTQPSQQIDTEKVYRYHSLIRKMFLFFILYTVVFLFAANSDSVSKVVVPIFDVTIPKQIYDAFFDVLILLPVISAAVKMNIYERHKVINLVLFALFLVALLNIIVVVLDPSLTKTERYYENGSIYTLGYGMTYVLALLFPVLLDRFKSKDHRLLWGLFIIVVCASIYFSGYLIALIGIIIALISKLVLSLKNRLVVVAALIITVCGFMYLIISGSLQELLLELANLIDIDLFSERLRQIVDFMNSGYSVAVSGTTTYRFYIYKDTWEHFLKSPIFGNYILGIFEGSYDHATFLDILSCGGLVLGAVFIGFIRSGYSFGCTFLHNHDSKSSLLSCYVTYVFFMLTNPVLSYRILGILFVIAPLALSEGELIDKRYENYDYT